jgi:hypothetical protein
LKRATRFPSISPRRRLHPNLTNRNTNNNSHKKWINFRGHSTGFSSVLTATPAPLIPAPTNGSYFLQTRITEDGRTRYLNLREPLVITAAQPPPIIVPGSLRFEAGLFTLTIRGSTGQQVIIQAATTLDDWQTIDTITLTSPNQDFSDPDSPSFTKRFYRIAAAAAP